MTSRHISRHILIFATCFAVAESGGASETNAILGAWFNAQTNLQTWSADFVQTRTLKALTQPLQTSGKLWFAAPDKFRWELGDPAQTIALRLDEHLLVIYPRLRRVERYPLSGQPSAQWRDALALLEAGFPRSRAEFEKQFRLVSLAERDGACELALEPRSAASRRLLARIQVTLRTNDYFLLATQVEFRDGSSLRNDFTNAVMNVRLDPALLNPELDADYTVVEPFRR